MKDPRGHRNSKENAVATDSKQIAFSPEAFLASAGLGRRIVHLKAKETFFSQGSTADSIFIFRRAAPN